MKYEYRVYTFKVENGQETENYLNNAGMSGFKVINTCLINIEQEQMMQFVLEKEV